MISVAKQIVFSYQTFILMDPCSRGWPGQARPGRLHERPTLPQFKNGADQKASLQASDFVLTKSEISLYMFVITESTPARSTKPGGKRPRGCLKTCSTTTRRASRKRREFFLLFSAVTL